MATLKLKFTGSLIGLSPRQRAILKGLGLSRPNRVVERVDSPEIRGMVAKVGTWVKVLEGEKKG